MCSDKHKFDCSPNLFKRDDGTPMEFFIEHSPDSNDIAQLILEGGGIVVKSGDTYVPNSRIIRLASSADNLSSRSDHVCSSFIYASCLNNRCLDPKDFLLQPHEKPGDDSMERENICKSSPNERLTFDFKILLSIVKYLAKEKDIWKCFCWTNKEFENVDWEAVRLKFILWAYNCLQLTASEDPSPKSSPVSSPSKVDENSEPENLGKSNENPKDKHSHITKEPHVRGIIKEPLPLTELQKESAVCGSKMQESESECSRKMNRYDLRKIRIKKVSPNCESKDDSSSSEGSDTDLNFSDNEKDCNSVAPTRQFPQTSTFVSSPSKIDENILLDNLGESNDNPNDKQSDITKEPNMREKIKEPLPLKDQESVNGKNNVSKKGSEWLGKDLERYKLRKTSAIKVPLNCESDDGSSEEGSDSDQSFISHKEGSDNSRYKKPRAYSIKEDLILLKWIILRRNKIPSLTGNRIWQFIEKRKVLPGRSWQSMRERFRKRVLPNIKKYPLSMEEFKSLRQIGVG